MKGPIVQEAQRRMGRPTLEAASALKERLLASALEMLCLHGIDGLAMDALAQQADVTKRTIYRHFENKMALVEAVVDREIDRLEAAAIVPAEGAPVDPLTQLQGWSRHFFLYTLDTQMRRFSIFLCFEQLNNTHLASKMRHWTMRMITPPIGLISDAQANGQIRAGDATMFGLLLIDLLQGPNIRKSYNCSQELVTGGLSNEAFFMTRWAAFMKLTSNDTWMEMVRSDG